MSFPKILYFLFSISLTLSYIYLIWKYLSIWKKIPIWEIPNKFKPTTPITILIPARNEAQNIKNCLHSIFQNNYPKELFEVFILDDFSTDNTALVVEDFCKKNNHSNLKLLPLSDFIQETDTQSFKKKAIEIGISQAKGVLIMTTDADCIVPTNWLFLVVSFYEKSNLQLIAAPVNFYQEKKLLEKFQSLDFMGMMCVTGAGINSNLQKMCNGANLAYSKKAFKEVNGFEDSNHLASGDDMFLMHKIATHFPNQIGFLKNEQATVLTEAKPDLASFFSQRLRWATKNTSYSDWKVTAVLAMVFFLCCNILLSLFLIPFWGWFGVAVFLIQLFSKSIADYFFLGIMSDFFKRKILMSVFIPSQVLHLLYIVLIGILANFKKEYLWKGRITK